MFLLGVWKRYLFNNFKLKTILCFEINFPTLQPHHIYTFQIMLNLSRCSYISKTITTLLKTCKSSRDSHLFNKWEARYIAGGNNRCGQQNNFFFKFIYLSFVFNQNQCYFIFIVTFILVMVFAFFFIIYLGLGRIKTILKMWFWGVVLLFDRMILFLYKFLFYSFILSNKWLDWVWSNSILFYVYPKCKYNFRIHFSSLRVFCL